MCEEEYLLVIRVCGRWNVNTLLSSELTVK